jgi:SH3 domain-containing protein
MRSIKVIFRSISSCRPGRRVAALLGILLAAVVVSTIQADETQQVLVSATPVPVSLPSPLPFVTEGPLATEPPTRTPTPNGIVLLEALSEANVRSEPDTNSERLGTIRNGDVYTVVGQYYRWYKFEYDTSPSGFGWVFDDLVHIIGDENSIADLTQTSLPTLDPIIAGQTGTVDAVTQTPGGILTLTANAGAIPLPGQSNPGNSSQGINLQDNGSVLPTYTFPANILLPTPLPTLPNDVEVGTATEATGDTTNLPLSSPIPPIAPILVLGALGLLGLFISSYRR